MNLYFDNIQPNDNTTLYGVKEYDSLFYEYNDNEYEESKKYDESDESDETDESDEYEEYEEYNCDIENDYRKMDDLIDNYFVNHNEIEYVNSDYVDLIENQNMNLINNYKFIINKNKNY